MYGQYVGSGRAGGVGNGEEIVVGKVGDGSGTAIVAECADDCLSLIHI